MIEGRPRVTIAGGSLGGLTAGLHLGEIGCNVDVHERSRSPLEGRGAGIVLHPASVRYLETNGSIRVEDISTRVDRLRYLDREGKILHEEPCGYRFTSYYALHQGLLSCFDPDRYHLGEEVLGFEQNDEGVDVHLRGGMTDAADLLVFADGIHSTGRALLLPELEPRYAGYVGWRGTVLESDLDRDAFESLHEAIIYYVGEDTHVLTYPIPDFEGSVVPGHRRINFVWYRNVPAGGDIDDLMTDRNGVRRGISLAPGAVQARHIEALFRAAEDLPPAIAETVVRSEEPFVQAVFDIDVPRMVFGRACLIGDAAFVIRPHAAAGTAKAAEDAFRLAQAVAKENGDIPAALRVWEPGQLEVGRAVLERAGDLGDRSQFLGTYRPPDPYFSFGLREPGDSWMPG